MSKKPKIDFEKYKEIFQQIIHDVGAEGGTINLAEAAINSMILYSASVVVGRALPDLRDGLKPAHRRLLYAMKYLGISHSGAFKKSARITGTTIGLYHPHGDKSAYDTMVGMSQEWKLNCPLVDGQGNFGSIDGDNPADQRYTESRMTKFGSLLFRDLDKNVVDFRPNYDGEETEPSVLPSPYPNIIINGVLPGSIAVGMASIILPHNPIEVMDVVELMLKNKRSNKKTSAEDILALMPGPDFPTGGFVYGTDKSMLNIIKTGKGKVRMRAKHHIEKQSRGRSSIIVTEIPWMRKKSDLIQDIVTLKKNASKDDRMAGAITNILDNSDHEIRVVIDIKAGYDPEMIWSYILHNTNFDCSITSSAVVIDQEMNLDEDMAPTPKEYGLQEILDKYLDHRITVVFRKYSDILSKTLARKHIVQGLLKAIDIIDSIIKIIRSAKSEDNAFKDIRALGFSKLQTKAILNIRLAKLLNLEKLSLEKEHTELDVVSDNANEIVSDKKKQIRELLKEFKEIKKTIGHERRSVIDNSMSEFDVIEAAIPEEDMVVYITDKNYVKRVVSSDLGKKKGELILQDGDSIKKIFKVKSTQHILFVSEKGQVFGKKIVELPDSSTGNYIENIVELSSGDRIIDFLIIDNFNKEEVLVLLSSDGMIKKSSLDQYKGALRTPGITGIGLKEDAVVLSSGIIKDCSENQPDVVIVTKDAKAIRFNLESVSCIGRASKGVTGIKAKKGDIVVGMIIPKNEKYLLATITKSGMTKVSPVSSLKEQNRAGVGVICMGLTKRSGEIVSVLGWAKEDSHDLVAKMESGETIVLESNSIEGSAKNTRGAQLFDIAEDNSIISVELFDK